MGSLKLDPIRRDAPSPQVQSPFMSRAYAFVTYEEVYGSKLTDEKLASLVRSIPTEYWLRIASMGRIFLEHYETKLEYQRVLMSYLCPKSLLEADLQFDHDGPRVFFHRTQFLCLTRLALMRGVLALPVERTEEEVRDITTRCLLGISSFLCRQAVQQFWRPRRNLQEIRWQWS